MKFRKEKTDSNSDIETYDTNHEKTIQENVFSSDKSRKFVYELRKGVKY